MQQHCKLYNGTHYDKCNIQMSCLYLNMYVNDSWLGVVFGFATSMNSYKYE